MLEGVGERREGGKQSRERERGRMNNSFSVTICEKAEKSDEDQKKSPEEKPGKPEIAIKTELSSKGLKPDENGLKKLDIYE